MAQIIITRKSSMAAAAQSHDVYLYNTLVGRLENGGTLIVNVGVGNHLLSFKSNMKAFGKNATFTAVVNDENEVVQLQTKFAMSGDYVVEYADNKPHILMTSPSVETVNNDGDNAEQSAPITNRCAMCGKEYIGNFCPSGCNSPYYKPKKKKSNGKLVASILVAIIGTLAAIAAISVAVEESGGDLNKTSSSQSEQEIEYIEVTANQLWQDFSDNEVAAEQKYTGKYVKVTGVVSEINSASTLISANVLLTVDDAMFSCVQCNFTKKNSEQLANLTKGQTVTIIGTCGDLNLNVHINDCEIE